MKRNNFNRNERSSYPRRPRHDVSGEEKKVASYPDVHEDTFAQIQIPVSSRRSTFIPTGEKAKIIENLHIRCGFQHEYSMSGQH